MLQQYLRTKQTEISQCGLQHRGNLLGALHCPRSKQKPHLRDNCITNSPLCNSSPRASTAALEKITKRYFGLNEFQCLCVFWLQLKMNTCRDDGQKHASMDTEHCRQIWARQKLNESEVRDKGTSTSSWSSIHQQNRVEDYVNYTQSCKLPATQAVILSPSLR